MPKVSVLTKEVILDAAFSIVRENGLNALSARNVARQIGSSVRPIYNAYVNMEGLKQELAKKIEEELNHHIFSYKKTGHPFLDLGLGYIHAAYVDPILFQVFYYGNMLGKSLDSLVPDGYALRVLQQELSHFSISEQKIKEMVINGWIFVFGLALFVASGTLIYDEEKIIQHFTVNWNNIIKGLDRPDI